MNNLFIRELTIDWTKIKTDSYLREIEAIKNVEKLAFHRPITFFVGENGSGKSTLLEAIAVAYGFNPEGGTKNYSFSTYDSHSELYDAVRITKGVRRPKGGYFLRAESFYNVATKEQEYADIYNFDMGEVHLCDYEETDSYAVTEMFINNRENCYTGCCRNNII